MIICVGGIKGGNGKSTMAIHLVLWLTRAGHDVLLVDADKQQTATKFTALRNRDHPTKIAFPIMQIPSQVIFKQLDKLKKEYEIIVVDAGEGENPALRASMLACDYFLIPVRPYSFDSWSPLMELRVLINQIAEMRLDRPMRSFSFLNMADAHMDPDDKQGARNREVAAYLMTLENVEYIPHPIVLRRSIDWGCGHGLSIMEVKEKEAYGAKFAKKEVNLLFTELTKRINND